MTEYQFVSNNLSSTNEEYVRLMSSSILFQGFGWFVCLLLAISFLIWNIKSIKQKITTQIINGFFHKWNILAITSTILIGINIVGLYVISNHLNDLYVNINSFNNISIIKFYQPFLDHHSTSNDALSTLFRDEKYWLFYIFKINQNLFIKVNDFYLDLYFFDLKQICIVGICLGVIVWLIIIISKHIMINYNWNQIKKIGV